MKDKDGRNVNDLKKLRDHRIAEANIRWTWGSQERRFIRIQSLATVAGAPRDLALESNGRERKLTVLGGERELKALQEKLLEYVLARRRRKKEDLWEQDNSTFTHRNKDELVQLLVEIT